MDLAVLSDLAYYGIVQLWWVSVVDVNQSANGEEGLSEQVLTHLRFLACYSARYYSFHSLERF